MAQVFTGSPGVQVPLEVTIDSFKRVVAGEFDHLPESAFYMVGGIDEVVKKAETHGRGRGLSRGDAAMADTLQFELVSPERKLVVGGGEQVQIPGMNGDFTAMPNHAPYLTTLRPGVVRVVATERDDRVSSSPAASPRSRPRPRRSSPNRRRRATRPRAR